MAKANEVDRSGLQMTMLDKHCRNTIPIKEILGLHGYVPNKVDRQAMAHHAPIKVLKTSDFRKIAPQDVGNFISVLFLSNGGWRLVNSAL